VHLPRSDWYNIQNPELGVISVIIPTRNAARSIGNCLRSINNQSYSNIETIVVDAFSTDYTVRIATQLGAKVVSLDSERARAKNEGISNSRGEFLLFIDSDMVLEKKVIEECVHTYRSNPEIAGVIIPERSIGNSPWVRVRDFERNLYAGSKIESARFFERTSVLTVGGFDEEFVFFEESTLPQRIENIGLDVNARISSCILHDEGNFDLRRWLSKKKYYSDTSKAYKEKYKYADSQMSILYRLKVFTSNGKWKLLLRHPFLSAGLFTLKTLELISSRIQQPAKLRSSYESSAA
jgi:glycosyltransferase involved in cell wall biosynthesis